jgi:hypothetical protein
MNETIKSKLVTMKKVMVTMDQALGEGITLKALLRRYHDMGFIEISRHEHCAVGTCVLMVKEVDNG